MLALITGSSSGCRSVNAIAVLVEDNQARPFNLEQPGAFLIGRSDSDEAADTDLAELADSRGDPAGGFLTGVGQGALGAEEAWVWRLRAAPFITKG